MKNNRVNRYISTLYRYGQRYFTQELRRAGFELGVGWLPTLMQAYRTPGVTQDGIALQAGMDKGTVARAVKQMEEAGLLTRVADEADRRVNHIHPTQRALELRPRVEIVLDGLHNVLYTGLSPEEIRQAASLLQRMQENMAEHLGTRQHTPAKIGQNPHAPPAP